jgi:inorganic phosphate transporter, PiT family
MPGGSGRRRSDGHLGRDHRLGCRRRAWLRFHLIDIETPQGFSAETSSAVVILAASQAGYPLSTTHVTSGGVMGAGVGKRAAEVKWSTAQQMAFAWLITIPSAALMAAALYFVVDELGDGALGPLLVSGFGLLAAVALFWHVQRSNAITAQDV